MALPASGASAAGTAELPLAAPNPSEVSRNPPNHLVQSTGNLYWTSNYCCNEHGPSTASVYRASKSSTPGGERLLYHESRSSTT